MNTLVFVSSLQANNGTLMLLEEEEEGDNSVTVIKGTFVAASENGFMHSCGDEATWTLHRTQCSGMLDLVSFTTIDCPFPGMRHPASIRRYMCKS